MQEVLAKTQAVLNKVSFGVGVRKTGRRERGHSRLVAVHLSLRSAQERKSDNGEMMFSYCCRLQVRAKNQEQS